MKIKYVVVALSLFFVQNLFSQEKITIYGFKGPSGLGMVRLFENPPSYPGFIFNAEALPSADVMVTRFVNGQAKIGILPPNVAAKLAASGVDIGVAAVVGNGMLSLVSSDPGLKKITDLAEKTVHVAGQASTPDYVMRTILDFRGMKHGQTSSPHLDYSMATPEMVQALAAGKIQYALLPEPFVTMALKANPSLRRTVDIQSEWKAATGQVTYPMTVIAVDRTWAIKNPAALKAVLKAWEASVSFVVKHPQEASIEVEAAGLGIKAPIAQAAIPFSAYVFVSARNAKAQLESLYKVFLQNAAASVGGRLPDESFYLKW